MIRSTGFYNAKSRSLMGMAQAVVERHGGEIPDRMADLVKLPGVGRKTANVVLSVAFGKPGLPVDTHVLRLSRRLGLTAEEDPVKAKLVELRFFTGMSMEEAARTLDIAGVTAKRYWRYARAWLHQRISDEEVALAFRPAVDRNSSGSG